jgi:gas vesicle protein
MDFNYLIAPLATVIGIIATILTVTGSNRSVRTDMAEMRTELKGEMAEMRIELKSDMAELRTELKNDMSEMRTELKGDIAELKTEFRSEIGRIDKRMDNLDDRIYDLTLTMVGMRQDFNRATTPHTAMRSNDLAAA